MGEGYTDTTNTPYLMGKTKTDPDSLNRLVVWPPDFLDQYSNTSKSEITIKEKTPWGN